MHAPLLSARPVSNWLVFRAPIADNIIFLNYVWCLWCARPFVEGWHLWATIITDLLDPRVSRTFRSCTSFSERQDGARIGANDMVQGLVNWRISVKSYDVAKQYIQRLTDDLIDAWKTSCDSNFMFFTWSHHFTPSICRWHLMLTDCSLRMSSARRVHASDAYSNICMMQVWCNHSVVCRLDICCRQHRCIECMTEDVGVCLDSIGQMTTEQNRVTGIPPLPQLCYQQSLYRLQNHRERGFVSLSFATEVEDQVLQLSSWTLYVQWVSVFGQNIICAV